MNLFANLIIILTALIGLAFRVTGEAQKGPDGRTHKVVFEVAIEGSEPWRGVLRNVANVQKALGAKATRIEVVVHGKGIGMLLAKTADADPEMRTMFRKLHAEGVIFAACENTMRRMQITTKQLLPIAITVDSGVGEVIRKQEAGYSYIKS